MCLDKVVVLLSSTSHFYPIDVEADSMSGNVAN